MKDNDRPRPWFDPEIKFLLHAAPNWIQALYGYGSDRVYPLVKPMMLRRSNRIEQTIEVASKAANLSPAEFVDRIARDERLSDLMYEALGAAAATALEDKRAALGRALASGVLAADDALVDEAELALRAIANLEPPHVRVLTATMARVHNVYGAHRKTIKSIAAKTRFSTELVEALMQQLYGAGLVTQEFIGESTLPDDSPDFGRRGAGSREDLWIPTRLGLRVNALLHVDSDEPDWNYPTDIPDQPDART